MNNEQISKLRQHWVGAQKLSNDFVKSTLHLSGIHSAFRAIDKKKLLAPGKKIAVKKLDEATPHLRDAARAALENLEIAGRILETIDRLKSTDKPTDEQRRLKTLRHNDIQLKRLSALTKEFAITGLVTTQKLRALGELKMKLFSQDSLDKYEKTLEAAADFNPNT